MIDLSSLRVTEFSSRYPAVAMAGRELVAAGALVTRYQTEASTVGWEENSPELKTALIRGKRLESLDPDGGVDAMVQGCAGAHLVLLGDEYGRRLRSALVGSAVVGIVSGNGSVGPLHDSVGSEITAQAISGFFNYLGDGIRPPRSGGPPPIRIGADLAEFATSCYLLQAVLAMLYAGKRGVVEVPMASSLMSIKTVIWAARTNPDVWEGLHLQGPSKPAERGWQTATGSITMDFRAATKDDWIKFVEHLGIHKAVIERLGGTDARWADTVGNGDLVGMFRDVYESVLAGMAADDVSELVRAHGGMSVPFNEIRDVLEHAQPRAMEAFVEYVTENGCRVKEPRPILRATTETIEKGKEHYNRSDRNPAEPATPIGHDSLPLTGLRVADFSAAGVGPYAGALLQWLGADVVKVNPPWGDFILATPPKLRGESTTYAALNVGKRQISVDLRAPESREGILNLIRRSDVVIENFRPGTLDKLGLSFSEMTEVNPQIILLSLSGFGEKGPMADWRCTDPHMQAFSGFASTHDSEAPELLRYLAVMDLVTGAVGAQLITAGLAAQRLTNSVGGMHLKSSMLESALALQLRSIVEVSSKGTGLRAAGVVVPTRQRWVALDVSDDDHFRCVCELAERLELVDDPQFATAALRRSNGRELERVLSETGIGELDVTQLLGQLTRAGVPVAPALEDDMAEMNVQFYDTGALRRVPMSWNSEELLVSCGPWLFDSIDPPRDLVAPAGLYAPLLLRSDGTLVKRERDGH